MSTCNRSETGTIGLSAGSNYFTVDAMKARREAASKLRASGIRIWVKNILTGAK